MELSTRTERWICCLEKDKAIGRKCFESFRDPRCGTDECTLKQILSGKERVEIEAERHTENGKDVPVSLIATPLRDKGGKIVGVIESFRDVTKFKQIEEELRISEKQAKAQYKGIPVPTYTWQKVGNDFILIDYNYAAERITKGQVSNFLGIKLSEAYKVQPKIIDDMWECLNKKTIVRAEMPYEIGIAGKGKVFNIHYSFAPPDLVLVHTEDITERKKAEEKKEWLTKKLKRQAQIDGLTKVLNRQHLDGELKLEIQRARRYNRSLSLIMLDIDHFKKVNDSCGHRTGDQVLKRIAKNIKDIIRTTDFVGRYGGEEFLVVCPETVLNEALNLAKRMQEKIRKLQVTDREGLAVKVTASFGVGQFSEPENFDKLVIKVDDALYKAKNTGRNRICSAED